jgi:RNA polymerase sigma factor (sigma-70 family)
MANLQTGSLLDYLQGIACRETFEHSSDRQLLQRFANQGDEAAFAALVRRHGSMVWHVSQRIVDQKQDAEDVFQAVFLVLSRKAGRIAWRDSVANWLYQVAFRLAHEARTTSRRRQAKEGNANPHRTADDPLADISLREILVLLEEELSKLPSSLRMPIVLCLLEGEGQETSARRLGWSLATLKRRLTRGRQVLHARLARRGLTLTATLGAVAVTHRVGQATTPASLLGTSIRTALAFQQGHSLMTTAANKSTILAQTLLRRMLAARFALVGFIAALCTASVGLGVAWQLGSGAIEATSIDNESSPIRAVVSTFPDADQPDDLPAGAVARLGTLRFREGFPGEIRHSPDGKTFVSLDSARMLRTFDTETGRMLTKHQLPASQKSVHFYAAFSRNLDRLIMSVETGFDVWDLKKYERIRTLRMDAPMAFRTALSPDDRTFAALELGGGNGVLRVWDIESGETRIVGDHVAMITALTFSPDSQNLVAIDGKGSHCWQVSTGKALWHNNDRIDRNPVFLPDGRSFVGILNKQGPTLKHWDAFTGQQIAPGKLPKIEFNTSLMLSPNGRTLALLTLNKGIRLWDLKSGAAGPQIKSATDFCAFSPDGKTLLGATGTSLARWDVATGKAIYPDTKALGHSGPVHALAFTKNGSQLISSSTVDQTMRMWNVAARQPVRQVDAAKIRYSVLAVSPAGNMIAGAAEGLRDYGMIRIWDTAKGKVTKQFSARSPAIADERVILSALRFSSDDGRLFAFGAVDDDIGGRRQAVVVAFDVSTCRQLYRRTGPPLESAKCVTQDGRYYLANDGRIFVTDGGKQFRDVKTTFNGSFDSCVFSPDQSLLAGTISEPYETQRGGGSLRKGIKIWEIASAKVIAEFPIPTAFNHLVFTPDGRYLIATDAAAIHVFDVLHQSEVAQYANTQSTPSMSGGDFSASALCVSPDGRTLASGHPDTTILLWNLPQPSKQKAKSLTAAEANQAWTTLAGSDAQRARRVMSDLILSLDQTIAFVKAKLKPVTDAQPERIKALIAGLDAREFDQREAAHRALIQLNGLAEPEIQEALKRSPSAEAQRRLNQILLNSPSTLPPAELQSIRALQVLEQIASPEAKQLLRSLAGGVPAASLTRRAKEALERLPR